MKLFSAIILVAYCILKVVADDKQWTVNGDNGYPCLIAEMNIKTNFSYNSTDSTVKNIEYEIPNNVTSVNTDLSKCGDQEDNLIVGWSSGNSFEIKFVKNNRTYELSTFKIALNLTDVMKDARDNITIEIFYVHSVNESTSFVTPANFSYHCNKEQTLNGTDGNGSFIVLSKVQFEAFKSDKTKKFSLAKDCESNFKPDIVPIAVGLSLIVLIIIVLIAYIVGRRRQQARGYLNIM